MCSALVHISDISQKIVIAIYAPTNTDQSLGIRTLGVFCSSHSNSGHAVIVNWVLICISLVTNEVECLSLDYWPFGNCLYVMPVRDFCSFFFPIVLSAISSRYDPVAFFFSTYSGCESFVENTYRKYPSPVCTFLFIFLMVYFDK